MAKGPIALTAMTVAPWAAAKWWAFAGTAPGSPTFIGLGFDASKVSPMPTSRVPFLPVIVSLVGGECVWVLLAAGTDSSTVNGAAFPGSPLTTAIVAPLGKTSGAGPHCSVAGLVVGAACE